MYEDLDDAALLIVSKGRPDAFGSFYERHAEDLLRYFARRTLDADAAAELTAETFAEAFASRERFRDTGVEGAAWLYGIARHQLSRFHRHGLVDERARRRLGLPLRAVSEDDYERIEELMDLAGTRSAVLEAFSELTETERRALELRVVEGRGYVEVARELGITEPATRARVSRGLRHLAALLDQKPEIERVEAT